MNMSQLKMHDTVVHNDEITNCYCGCTLDNWKSEFDSTFHYKTVTCKECNRKNRVQVSFEGSGFDRWHELRLKKDTFEVLVNHEHSKVEVMESRGHGGGHGGH